jgi:hypothetical protein
MIYRVNPENNIVGNVNKNITFNELELEGKTVNLKDIFFNK